MILISTPAFKSAADKGKKDRLVPLPEKIIPENKKPHISK